MKKVLISIAASLVFVAVSLAQAPASIKVEVGGKVTEMSAADLAKLPRKEVTGKDHDGRESTFSGVEIREILTAAGAKLGADIRGKRLAEYLLVEAADGYRAVYALAELDPEFSADVIILADKQDGKPLDEKNGKVQVIAPADKRHGRWVRQVTALRLRVAP
jgi:hypothetical protein